MCISPGEIKPNTCGSCARWEFAPLLSAKEPSGMCAHGKHVSSDSACTDFIPPVEYKEKSSNIIPGYTGPSTHT